MLDKTITPNVIPGFRGRSLHITMLVISLCSFWYDIVLAFFAYFVLGILYIKDDFGSIIDGDNTTYPGEKSCMWLQPS